VVKTTATRFEEVMIAKYCAPSNIKRRYKGTLPALRWTLTLR